MSNNLLYFEMANEFNKTLHSDLVKNQCHFRGNLNSFSLVSLSPEKPELGISGLKTEKDAKNAFDRLSLKKHPKRPTPEKSLQAWIINQALNNNFRLPFDENIKFITSELALKNDKRVRVVNDILGYCEKDKQICVVELKSKRLMQELINQVKDFEDIILTNQPFFTELLKLYDHQNPNGFQKVKKIIVWPYAETSPKEELKKEDVDILEVTYENSYKFTVFK